MAGKFVFPLMVCKRNIAVLALDGISAHPAQNESRKSPPVQKQYRLIAQADGFLDRIAQDGANQHASAAFAKFFAHIYYFSLRQRTSFDPLRQLKQLILSLLCIVISFQRRRGRAQDYSCPAIPAANQGQIPSIVKWRFMLVIR